MRRRFMLCLISLVMTLIVSVHFAAESSAERILVVGDSITGHSMNLPYGFTHEVRAALADAGVTDVEFVPLGGSGQQVRSWHDIVIQSETANRGLDIPGIMVKDEFDKGADTALIFLGMNDVLCPGIGYGPEAMAIWKADYQTLINLVQKRCGFKKLILCGPSMLSENPYSFKNRQMDQMDAIVEELAKENNAVYCTLREDFKRFIDDERMHDPNVRITLDYVHANKLGHFSFTYSMLQALGQGKAAELYFQKKATDVMKNPSRPGMSLYVVPDQARGKVVLRGNLRGESKDKLSVELPAELAQCLKVEKVTPMAGEGFEIVLNGTPNVLKSIVKVTAGDVSQTIQLNAPYLVAFGFTTPGFGNRQQFQLDKAFTELDRDILAGRNPLNTKINGTDGQPIEWKMYYPAADLTGGNDPNAIDFSALHNGEAFAGAYIVRTVYSPKNQKVKLNLTVNSFSTNEMLTVYVNQTQAWQDFFVRGGQKNFSTEVELKQGWNRIAARADHTVWQWVVSMALTDSEGKDLPELKYGLEQ